MNSYTEALNRRLDAMSPDLSSSLSNVDHLSGKLGQSVLRQILTYACQATHESAILAGRRAFAALPQPWLDVHLDAGIAAHIDLQDYWGYGRLLELLEESYPPLLPKYLQLGLSSANADLRELAEDHSKPG